MATYNLASKFSKKVDEAFTRDAIAPLVTNQDYKWDGVKTVNVYSIPVVELNDYNRGGANRYGTPDELGNAAQTLSIEKDRGWTFTIDKGNNTQSEMVMEAGKACARQVALKVIPEIDAHVFKKIAIAACATEGHSATTAITKTNAYAEFLKAQEVLGNENVPDEGRVCLCSYAFAGALKQDAAFMRDCDTAQNMQVKGMLGEVDGAKLIRVPSSRLPAGCDFILCHPIATVAPKQLNEYKIHTDAPGISGWLCEGRVIYDAFVLDNKKSAVYYHGTSSVTE
jgi:N4-gp56 family major capsid protein